MTTNFKDLVEVLHDSLIEANVDDKQFDIIWSAINDVHSKLRIYGVIKLFKTEKIQERINQLKTEKETLKNKHIDNEGQREFHLSKIRVINTRIGELQWVLNVL